MKAKSVGFGRNLKEPTDRQAIENALLEHAQERAEEAAESSAMLDHLKSGNGVSSHHMDPPVAFGDDDEGDIDPEAAARGSDYAIDERNRPLGAYRNGTPPPSANDCPWDDFRLEDSLSPGYARRA